LVAMSRSKCAASTTDMFWPRRGTGNSAIGTS
jgi:hypothetical protein